MAINGEEGDFLRLFDRLHREAIGSPYMCAFARDRKLAGAALAVYGPEGMAVMARAFFDAQRRVLEGPAPTLHGGPPKPRLEDWIGKARPDMVGFVGQIPNLLKVVPPIERGK